MIDITLKQIPIGQYEYVEVTFPLANVDVVIPYEHLKVESPQDVLWLDVRQGATSAGVPAIVYRVVGAAATPFGSRYIVLRSSVGGYTTKLLLFTERV